MPVLVAIDAVGIQRYVFASNRLRDVIGASSLVELATSNGRVGLVGHAVEGLGQVLIAAGGNCVLRFDDQARAKRFTSSYTRQVLLKVPGLDVAVAHRAYADGELAQALLALQVDLARAKAELHPSTPLLGLGVNAMCQVTGRPATDVGSIAYGPERPLSNLAQRARSPEVHRDSQRRWQGFLDGVAMPGTWTATFPTELDELGRTTGERSLIGVVHVDGNGVGLRIVDWLKGCAADGKMSDDAVTAEYRRWSNDLSSLATRALQVVVERVANQVRPADPGVVLRGKVAALEFPLVTNGDQVRFPIRPILLGGDDLTFVCDGRIALDLAATAVDAFRQVIGGLGTDPLSACAGVAIVPSHSPFIRAYELAADLCASAKREARDNGWTNGALDWHLGAFRPGESVRSIRERQYRAGSLRLTCRPYPLEAQPPDVHAAVEEGWVPSWQWLSTELLGEGATGLRGESWSDRRSKVKALSLIAREGPDSVERSLAAWRLSAPGLQLPPQVAGGFWGTRTPLIDAAELLDRTQVLS